MKSFYLSLPIIFVFLIGCSTTCKVTNYSSKDEFYKAFNNSAYKREELKITLTNDSSIVVSNGAQISHDIMFLNDTILTESNSQIPMIKIKQASYNNHIQGAIPGLFFGPAVGAILGATGWIAKPKSGGNHPTFDQFTATIAGAFIGLFTGAMVGIIVGYSHYFIFSP